MFVLDTNVVSELRPGKAKRSPEVQQWAAERPARWLYLSAVTVLELETGVLAMERKDATQGKVLRAWQDALMREFLPQVLPFTITTSLVCAAMHMPNPKSFRDAMIAATAKEHGCILVTRNIEDFKSCGVELLNPWLQPDRRKQ